VTIVGVTNASGVDVVQIDNTLTTIFPPFTNPYNIPNVGYMSFGYNGTSEMVFTVTLE
jgi:hypothetical protein